MRKVLLLLSVVLLAGCTLPGDEEEEPAPAVFGACPHWLAGPDTVTASFGAFEGGRSFTVEMAENGTGDAVVSSYQGRALDMFVLSINTTGPVEMRVFAIRDGGPERLVIHHLEDGTWQAPPFLRVAGQKEVQVYLADPSFGASPDPAPVRIDVTAEEEEVEVAIEATPFYRVCGISLEDGASVP